jgi:lipoate-protein ligase A
MRGRESGAYWMLSVIVDDTQDPSRNLALDEALVRAGSLNPVLRVWQNAPSVIVGRFQNIPRVVDMAACARDGIQVVRRATGGVAIYTDPGSLNVTLVCSRPGPRPELDQLMITAVEGFGLPEAAARGGVVQLAWLQTRRATLVHATLHIRPVRAYGRGYLIDGEQPTLADHGLDVSLDAVRAAVFAATVERYGVACARPPNGAETSLRQQLYDTRYGDVTWHLSGMARPSMRLRSLHQGSFGFSW